jgi:hypothetical protein
MTKLHYRSEHVESAMADSDDLTNEELGAFCRLKWAMTLNGGWLPANEFARHSRAGDHFPSIYDSLKRFFEVIDGRATCSSLGNVTVKDDGTPGARRYERLLKGQELGTHTPFEWNVMVSLFDGCARCGTRETTKDHVVPLARGGCDCVANLQPLCDRCNKSKMTTDSDYRNASRPGWVSEYMSALGFVS